MRNPDLNLGQVLCYCSSYFKLILSAFLLWKRIFGLKSDLNSKAWVQDDGQLLDIAGHWPALLDMARVRSTVGFLVKWTPNPSGWFDSWNSPRMSRTHHARDLWVWYFISHFWSWRGSASQFRDSQARNQLTELTPRASSPSLWYYVGWKAEHNFCAHLLLWKWNLVFPFFANKSLSM